MARIRKNDSVSRHGKHAPDAFRISFYISAEEKAAAVLTAELQGKTLTDVLRSGLASEATRAGILANGCVAEKFSQRLKAYRLILEAEAQAKRRLTQ